MPEWWTDTYLAVEVRQWVGLGVLLVVAVLVRLLVQLAIRLSLRSRFAKADGDLWERERGRLGRALTALVVAMTARLGFPALGFHDTVESIVGQAASLVTAGALLLLGLRAVDIFTDELRRRAAETENRLDDQIVPLAGTILKGAVVLFGVLLVLGNFGMNVTSLVAGLGLGGLAVALAAQDSIRNLLGGVTIIADRPFQVGDWIVVGGIEGTVEHVGFRSSRVRTFYNSVVTVPNARIVDAHVDNMGLRQWRRYKTTLGVAYHTAPEQVQAFVEGVRALIRSNPGTRKDYYIVEFHGFGAASLDIMVYCFIDATSWNEELRTRHVLNLDIMRLAEDLGVEFAFPTQTLHVASLPGQPGAVPAPATREGLREIVERYAPEGTAGQRVDAPLTGGYDNEPE